MNKKANKRLHDMIDGVTDFGKCSPEDRETLAKYRCVLERVEKAHVKAPYGLTTRIMAALPETRRFTLREWLEMALSRRLQWMLPALGGALGMLAVLLVVWSVSPRHENNRVSVHFQIHSPGAQRVELLGDFNNWTPGALCLKGPDASGHWTADIEIPEGRYEYLFLVNGKVWVTDPNADAYRPDGFGRNNAVVTICRERS